MRNDFFKTLILLTNQTQTNLFIMMISTSAPFFDPICWCINTDVILSSCNETIVIFPCSFFLSTFWRATFSETYYNVFLRFKTSLFLSFWEIFWITKLIRNSIIFDLNFLTKQKKEKRYKFHEIPIKLHEIPKRFWSFSIKKKVKNFCWREKETKIHCFLLFLFSEKRKMIVSKKEKIGVF